MSNTMIEADAEMAVQPGVRITCVATEHVSLASHEKAIPVVCEIVVTNATEADLRDVVLQIESRPAVVQPLTLRIDRVPAGVDRHIETPDLRPDAGLLAGFTEASRLEMTVSLSDVEGERARTVAGAGRLLGRRTIPEVRHKDAVSPVRFDMAADMPLIRDDSQRFYSLDPIHEGHSRMVRPRVRPSTRVRAEPNSHLEDQWCSRIHWAGLRCTGVWASCVEKRTITIRR
ncbi:hypothetical protein ACQKQD_31510 [Methylobacterium sp. NPDC080182]|uniref:hypothetical protein n=1 Tax=Methylobacterium sp. NPDC080182 TaxID=3390590 RepID=UPI003D056A3E